MAPVDAPPERVSEAFERLWVCYGTSAFHRHYHNRVVVSYRVRGVKEGEWSD